MTDPQPAPAPVPSALPIPEADPKPAYQSTTVQAAVTAAVGGLLTLYNAWATKTLDPSAIAGSLMAIAGGAAALWGRARVDRPLSWTWR